ncbi:MAG: MaoC family dehydratase [Betaproteobacteria bacterium]|nr:MaoC family dehydratase [Betaproteobacteria bacterium]MBT5671558.1 MaoC family dehydratase [Betaproteobacteria bacterium]MBT6183557.1 MaoC family dehydratase [Betaproteobacteria bacterium]MBT6530231.1 MaoC family dehydratase [Betaproteobacteria bacterium]MBT7427535.1 MaoC family dehydratase [Betaproteobacteria bacterium]
MGEVTVDLEEVVAFAKRYDPQPFHVDVQEAEKSIYGGIIASGWHTCSMVMRLMCDSYLVNSSSLGSPGIEEVKWLSPVYPGNVLSAFRTVVETRASASKPDRGIVKTFWEVENEKGQLVMSMIGINFFLRREAG